MEWKGFAEAGLARYLARSSRQRQINVFIWRKITGPRDETDWLARAGALAGAERLAVIAPAGERPARLEIYCATEAEALAFARQLGGEVRPLADDRWQPPPATLRGQPISMGGRLLVTAWPDELAALRAGRPDKLVLCIPAAMAFGTGEHATTGMCLRLLVNISRRRRGREWELLDLGTGSGILALAGDLLGATHALGLDHDPDAVRTAKVNAKLNGSRGGTTRFARADLLRWMAPAGRQWPVITANLFSELLIRLLPEVIVPTLAPGGDLILSGVLAEQADEVQAAAAAANLAVVTVKRRGKWRAFHCRSSGWPPDP